jgi:UDP-glucose pyrophosphorylase
MSEPVLVIMAAGMGSRYGGLKQMDPMDQYGHWIIDFSVYDAIEAGFKKVIFIIKKAIEKDFKESIGKRVEKYIEVDYVLQELDEIPEKFKIPEGRIRPWGTGHAILCCKDKINGPFAVINSDDFYGKQAYKSIYQHLLKADKEREDVVIGYNLGNTISDNGYVNRGICHVDTQAYLESIEEVFGIEKHGDIIEYPKGDNKPWIILARETIVSMNMIGFTADIMDELEQRFTAFLENEVPKNSLNSEFLIPTIIGELLKEEKRKVKVLISDDQWHGVTNKEDKPVVVKALQDLKNKGDYPEKLWLE